MLLQDTAAVDKAFDTLKTYDWGADRNLLNPIDAAIIATSGDAAARKDIEKRLLDVFTGGSSRSAKDFICRALGTIGTAQSVPALAHLLPDNDLSHMARYALQRITASEAVAAMRDAMPKLTGALKIGTIGSLGIRRDTQSVAALTGLLGDGDKAIAGAAAGALGTIGSPESGKALIAALKKTPAAVDASLICGDQLLGDGKKAEAVALFKAIGDANVSNDVSLAARRGLLKAAGR
ncbi:MAG: hypothetical protein HQ567_29790 [Candidatus Nealsonbacteria bacterium]|nr:hypothetical protein [Candidatus Nealsonbacteria bacterium]